MPTTLRGRTPYSTTASSSFSLALPAGTAVNDLMVVTVMGASDVVALPSGWGALQNVIGQEAQGGVYFKVVTSADITAGVTGTIALRSSDTIEAQLLVFVGSAFSLALVGYSREGIAGTNPTLGARTRTITPISATTGDMLVYFVGTRNGATAPTIDRGTLTDSNVLAQATMALYLESASSTVTSATVTCTIPANTGAYFVALKVAPMTRATTAYDTAVLADSPWRYFPLDEPEGVLANDASTNHVPATISGPVAAYRQSGPNPLTPAMTFNGQYLESPIDSGITGGDFTAEFWMNPTNLVAGAPKDFFGFNGETRFARSGDQGQPIGTVEVAFGSTVVTRSGGGQVVNGTAQHVVMRYTASTGVVDVLVNNALIYSVTQPANGFTATGMWRFLVASLTSVPIRYLIGTFSNLAFYKGALSNTRITAHYAAATSVTLAPSFAGTSALSATLRGHVAPLTIPPFAATSTLAATLVGHVATLTPAFTATSALVATLLGHPVVTASDFTLSGTSGSFVIDFAGTNPVTIHYTPIFAGSLSIQVTNPDGWTPTWTALDSDGEVLQDDIGDLGLVWPAGQPILLTVDADDQDLTTVGFTWSYAARASSALTLAMDYDYVEETPAGLVVDIANGVPGETVTFSLTGPTDVTDFQSVDLDGFGTAPDFTVQLPALQAGLYLLHVEGSTSGGEDVEITVESDALSYDDDAPRALDTPPAVAPIAKWRFYDLRDEDVTWTFEKNPESWTNVFPPTDFTHGKTTAVDGQPLTWQAASRPWRMEFTGTITTQAEYEALTFWSQLHRRFWLIDHRNRAWLMTIEQFDAQAQVKPGYPWLHKYTVKTLIFMQGTTD